MEWVAGGKRRKNDNVKIFMKKKPQRAQRKLKNFQVIERKRTQLREKNSEVFSGKERGY